MESFKWEPTEEEREVMEVVWMQVKGACEKLKGETNAQNEHVKNASRNGLSLLLMNHIEDSKNYDEENLEDK